MLAKYYAIASISLFFVCDGVTNQNNFIALKHDPIPNTEDKRTHDIEDQIKFVKENRIKFIEHGFSSNQIGLSHDKQPQDTRVVFQDGSKPDANAVIDQLDIKVPAKDYKPLKFTNNISQGTNKLFNNTGRLIFSDNPRPSLQASDDVGPLKFEDDNTKSPESNVIEGGTGQIVFQENQSVVVGGLQNQGGQPLGQKKRRRRRRQRYRRFHGATEVMRALEKEQRPLKLAQDMLKMVVDNDKKKCTLRMFCEQAYELTTQPKDTVNHLSNAISSISHVFKIMPTLKDKLKLKVDNLGSAMKEFAEAAFAGQTKGLLACREAYPECPSDPIELANYLIHFNGGFTHFYNGENYTQHNIYNLNRELGFEHVKTGNERLPPEIPPENQQSPYGDQTDSQQNYQANYQQGYQPNYQQNYPPNYQPSYQPNYQQGYQPNYQQNYPPNYQPSYQPNYQQAYQPNYQQNYPSNYQQNYQTYNQQSYPPNYQNVAVKMKK